MDENEVKIPLDREYVYGFLDVPEDAKGLVIFVHGSGSGRHSSRNQSVASECRKVGTGTLLMDLLTQEEEEVDNITRELRFDIPFLARRVIQVTEWVRKQPGLAFLPIGYIGSSTGAAAALVAAAEQGDLIRAVVSRGGRPDLAGESLPYVKAPTILIVGSHDYQVIELNRQAFSKLQCEKEIVLVPGATHLFEEPGTLEEASRIARDWFSRTLIES